ncbi:MAG: hypothetical protein ACLQU4_15430 [Limisphaerales bacterium]
MSRDLVSAIQMNKHWILFVSHLVFWFALAGMAAVDFDLSVTIANRSIPVMALLIVVLMPVLLAFSWKAGHDAHSRALRSYFIGFRWLGTMFLVLTLWLTWISLYAQSQADAAVKGLLGK